MQNSAHNLTACPVEIMFTPFAALFVSLSIEIIGNYYVLVTSYETFKYDYILQVPWQGVRGHLPGDARGDKSGAEHQVFIR